MTHKPMTALEALREAIEIVHGHRVVISDARRVAELLAERGYEPVARTPAPAGEVAGLSEDTVRLIAVARMCPDAHFASAVTELSSRCAALEGERANYARDLIRANERWQGAEAKLAASEAEARTRTARLEMALRPFAKFSSSYGRTARDDSWELVKSTTGTRRITMGDVRAAEDALSPQRQDRCTTEELIQLSRDGHL